MRAGDVRNLLRADHEEALEVAEQMQKAKLATRRKALLAKLKPALTAHSRAEEKQVYNALLKLKKSEKSHDIGNEGFVEHSLLDELLKRLAKTSAASDTWKAQAKVLHELLEHHIEEEQATCSVTSAKISALTNLMPWAAGSWRRRARYLACRNGNSPRIFGKACRVFYVYIFAIVAKCASRRCLLTEYWREMVVDDFDWEI